MEGRGVEGEGREGRDGKEREGNNVLPHLKRAVAAYEYLYVHVNTLLNVLRFMILVHTRYLLIVLCFAVEESMF